jgi:hypothetical protein
MSLNNIELSSFIVTEWYKDALLPLDKGPVPAPSAATQAPTAAVAPPPSPTVPSPAPAAVPANPSAATSPPPAPAAVPPPKAASAADPAPATATPPPQPTSPAAPAPYKFLGNNRRHITLLVHSPGSGFMPDNQLAFLTKILEACRMTLADVAIVNNAAAPVTITALRQQLQPKTVLLFGVDPTAIRLPINFPPFKQLSYDDCTYLSSPALDQLVPNTEDSKLLKSKLWVCLKTLFEV